MSNIMKKGKKFLRKKIRFFIRRNIWITDQKLKKVKVTPNEILKLYEENKEWANKVQSRKILIVTLSYINLVFWASLGLIGELFRNPNMQMASLIGIICVGVMISVFLRMLICSERWNHVLTPKYNKIKSKLSLKK